MLHTLLFSQSGPKASERPPDKLSSKASEAQLKGIQSSAPAIELRQSSALHLSVADMPSNSKSSRKKKAGKPTEPTLIVSPAASLKSTLNNGGKNVEKKGLSKQEQEPSSVPRLPKSSWFSLSTVWR